jgi:hypothetical protein
MRTRRAGSSDAAGAGSIVLQSQSDDGMLGEDILTAALILGG